MDYTIPLLLIFSAALVIATVLVYERLLEQARRENERLEADCDLFSELLNEALDRKHPARRLTTLHLVDGNGA